MSESVGSSQNDRIQESEETGSAYAPSHDNIDEDVEKISNDASASPTPTPADADSDKLSATHDANPDDNDSPGVSPSASGTSTPSPGDAKVEPPDTVLGPAGVHALEYVMKVLYQLKLRSLRGLVSEGQQYHRRLPDPHAVRSYEFSVADGAHCLEEVDLSGMNYAERLEWLKSRSDGGRPVSLALEDQKSIGYRINRDDSVTAGTGLLHLGVISHSTQRLDSRTCTSASSRPLP